MVKGYAATAGLAFDIARNNVDLPAFGNPTFEKIFLDHFLTIIYLKKNNHGLPILHLQLFLIPD